nr:MAG TPA: hypothetical protein [Caudoviricetes sp.]
MEQNYNLLLYKFRAFKCKIRRDSTRFHAFFVPLLCYFTTIVSLSCIPLLNISPTLTYCLFLYRIYNNGSIVVNGRAKYLPIPYIGCIFTSTNFN